MLVREIMDTEVSECTEDALLAKVYELIQMSPKNFVVVIDSSQHRVPIGIVNEHSICENLIRQSRKTKGLYAGSVMTSHIARIAETDEVDECRNLITSECDAIVVVNERRQFRGVLEPAAIRECLNREAAERERRSTFSGLIGQAIPATAEIPAFGWLK